MANERSNLVCPVLIHSGDNLPAIIDRARTTLENARTAAEVLETRELAGVVFASAKQATRHLKMKGAHDSLIAAAHRMQADALALEAAAKRRLADEYDRAQKAGEVQGHGGQGKRDAPDRNIPSVADLGLSRKAIHDARIYRDAEVADPGITQRTLTRVINAGQEPTKSVLRQAATEAARGGAHDTMKAPVSPVLTVSPTERARLELADLQRNCQAVTKLAASQTLRSFVRSSYRGQDRIEALKALRATLTALQEFVAAAEEGGGERLH